MLTRKAVHLSKFTVVHICNLQKLSNSYPHGIHGISFHSQQSLQRDKLVQLQNGSSTITSSALLYPLVKINKKLATIFDDYPGRTRPPPTATPPQSNYLRGNKVE